MKNVFLGLGTNLGEREKMLEQAISLIEKHIGHIALVSSVFQTEPWGFESKNEFLNMVVKVETLLAPSELLQKTLMIETMLGRVRGEKQYASRLIDIDLLLFDDQVIDDETLTVPHPLMHERRFVLVPLCEIAPDIIHPLMKVTVSSLLDSCLDKSLVKIYCNPDFFK